ncbi:MAG: hypothetical protein AADX96_12605 [Thiocapsa sp. C3-sup]
MRTILVLCGDKVLVESLENLQQCLTSAFVQRAQDQIAIRGSGDLDPVGIESQLGGNPHRLALPFIKARVVRVVMIAPKTYVR